MPTDEARIESLRARIAARKEKIASLPIIQKYNAANEADEIKAAKLANELAKKRADQARRDDSHAKILIGAGVLLLSPVALMRTMREVGALLNPRHRQWIEGWFERREVNVAGADTNARVAEEPISVTTITFDSHPTALPLEPVGEALKNVIRTLSEGDFGIIAPELLAHATQQNRSILEGWFAQLDENR